MLSAWRLAIIASALAVFAGLAGFMLFASSVSRYAHDHRASVRASGAEAMVVLTGGEDRVGTAFALFEQTRVRRLLISGVNQQTTREDLRRRTGLPATLFSCCVDLGHDALNTAGNARETRDWAQAWGFKRLAVVTSSYHMPRGLLELAHQLPSVELVPVAIAPRFGQERPWWLSVTAVRVLALEYAKSLIVRVRHGIEIAVLRKGSSDEQVTHWRRPHVATAAR